MDSIIYIGKDLDVNESASFNLKMWINEKETDRFVSYINHKKDISMQTTLTERDKKLLIFLSLFVIVVGIGYWGLRPIYKNIKETDEAIIDAQDLKTSNQLKIFHRCTGQSPAQFQWRPQERWSGAPGHTRRYSPW